MMKLSDFGLTVLKNFSTINSGLVLNQGKKQRTISQDQSILAEVELDDDIPFKFAVYDLNQFLGNIVTLDNPDLIFQEKFVRMDSGSMSLNYYSSAPELIDSPPDKELVMNSPTVEFDLSNSDLTKLLRLASMNNLPTLTVLGSNGEIRLQVHEKNNSTSNFATTVLSKYEGADFTVSFKTENLKLIPGDYHVKLKENAFAIFDSVNSSLRYFIAISK